MLKLNNIVWQLAMPWYFDENGWRISAADEPNCYTTVVYHIGRKNRRFR